MNNPSVSRSKEILKIRAEINAKETKETIAAGTSRQSRSGPENVHDVAEKEYYSKDGVKRIRHVSTKGSGLTTTLFSILYLYRRA